MLLNRKFFWFSYSFIGVGFSLTSAFDLKFFSLRFFKVLFGFILVLSFGRCSIYILTSDSRGIAYAAP